MLSVRHAVCGFYAILDRDDEALARALVREARVLQVRIKPTASASGPHAGHAPADLLRVGRMARRICDEAGAALIINDRVDLALAVDADGVHLGQTDLAIPDARRAIAASTRTRPLWIGASTHNVPQVHAAIADGADYLGFGPLFATATKQNPDPEQGLTGLAAAVAAGARRLPVVAIGGITAEHAPAIYATGADAICAIAAVNHAPDPARAARAFQRLSTTACGQAI